MPGLFALLLRRTASLSASAHGLTDPGPETRNLRRHNRRARISTFQLSQLMSSRLPARLPAYPFFLMDSISRRMRGGRSVQCLWQAISREYIRAMQ